MKSWIKVSGSSVLLAISLSSCGDGSGDNGPPISFPSPTPAPAPSPSPTPAPVYIYPSPPVGVEGPFEFVMVGHYFTRTNVQESPSGPVTTTTSVTLLGREQARLAWDGSNYLVSAENIGAGRPTQRVSNDPSLPSDYYRTWQIEQQDGTFADGYLYGSVGNALDRFFVRSNDYASSYLLGSKYAVGVIAGYPIDGSTLPMSGMPEYETYIPYRDPKTNLTSPQGVRITIDLATGGIDIKANFLVRSFQGDDGNYYNIYADPTFVNVKFDRQQARITGDIAYGDLGYRPFEARILGPDAHNLGFAATVLYQADASAAVEEFAVLELLATAW